MYLLIFILLILFFLVPTAFLIGGLVNYFSSNPAKKAKGKWFLMIALLLIGVEVLWGYTVCY